MESPARSAVKMITKVEAVDPMTVKLTLDTPFADMPLQLMDYRLRMIPEGSGDTIASTGIGTGPFKLEKFDPAGTTVVAANMDYYGGAPGVERMEIIGIPDAQARLQALLGGQIDMESGITPQQRVMFDSSDKYQMQEVPTGNWRGIVFRTDVAPFSDDPRVRKAMRMAADREALLALVEGGNGTVTCDTPVGPTDQYRADIYLPAGYSRRQGAVGRRWVPRWNRHRHPCRHAGSDLARTGRGLSGAGSRGRHPGQYRSGAD